MHDRAARFAEFLARLEVAPPASSAGEARGLLSSILNQVEDEFTSVPFDPDHYENDRRMYPPQSDAAREVESHPQITRYRSRGHNTWIGANGAIRIAEIESGDVVLDKPGADGCSIDLS